MKITDLIKLFFREERKFYFFIAKTAGYYPSNITLFKEAFVHKSTKAKHRGKPFNNERLEFLGDAVLDFVVADILYHYNNKMEEGTMTKIRAELVSRKQLNSTALTLGFGEIIKYRVGLSADKTHIPGDALEAFVAAIYIDGGIKKAASFVRKYIANNTLITNTIATNDNYKSVLLEWAQKNRQQIEFAIDDLYRTPGSDYNFICSIKDETGNELGNGHGKSKKEAEQRAAQKALENIDNLKF